MSKRVRCAIHWMLIGTLFVSLGGHLALLQTFAWGNMLVSFSRSDSIAEATKKTFDGDHPCSMCKVVKESKKQEEKKPVLKADSKMEVALPVPVRLKTLLGVPMVIPVPGYYVHGCEVCLGVLMQPPRAA